MRLINSAKFCVIPARATSVDVKPLWKGLRARWLRDSFVAVPLTQHQLLLSVVFPSLLSRAPIPSRFCDEQSWY